MPGTLALEMTRQFSATFSIDAFQSDGVTPQSLVGMTLYFKAEAPASLAKDSNANGIVITNTAGGSGCAILTIDPADTNAVPSAGVSRVDCQLTLQNGTQDYVLAAGSLIIDANAGTP